MIHIFGNISISASAISLLTSKHIPVYFYSKKWGKFKGCLITPHCKSNGTLLIKQFEAYHNKNKRLSFARGFLEGAKKSMEITLNQNIGHYDLSANDIPELMGKESNLWKYYYSSLKGRFKYFSFEKREYRPPKDEINAMISLGNSILYNVILSKIYESSLNPTISYLHEIMRYRDSLIYDISEIFKPIFVGRFVVLLVNKRIIRDEHFTVGENGKGVYLNEKGFKVFLSQFNNNLEKTFYSPRYKRKISNKTFIKYECHNLISALMNNKKYVPLILNKGVMK